MSETASATGVAAGRVDRAPARGPEHECLDAIIGRWINEGHTLNPDGTPGVRIVASDVYEWAPGGFFVVHPAYGRIGDIGVGGVEIIGYDAASRKYQVHFFDSQGNVTRHDLTIQTHVDLAGEAHALHRRLQRGRQNADRPPRTQRRRRDLGPVDARHPEKGGLGEGRPPRPASRNLEPGAASAAGRHRLRGGLLVFG